MSMSYIVAALLVLAFFAALLVQIAVATKSLRNSWYVSIFYLSMSGILIVTLVLSDLNDNDRRDRLLLALSLPSGTKVRINDNTMLIDVTVRGSALIYNYEVADGAPLPSQAEAINQNCLQPNLRAILELGATVFHNFVNASKPVYQVKVTRELCA